MALRDNRIGDFEFISLRGAMERPKLRISIDVRPGVDGVELVQSGKHGEPFQLMSFVDAETYESGRAEARAYESLIGEDAVTLVVGGVSSVDEGYKVVVLNVRDAQVMPCRRAIGGLRENSQAVIRAIWDLIAVEV